MNRFCYAKLRVLCSGRWQRLVKAGLRPGRRVERVATRSGFRKLVLSDHCSCLCVVIEKRVHRKQMRLVGWGRGGRRGLEGSSLSFPTPIRRPAPTHLPPLVKTCLTTSEPMWTNNGPVPLPGAAARQRPITVRGDTPSTRRIHVQHRISACSV